MEFNNKKPNLTLPQILEKLDKLYDKEAYLIKQIDNLNCELQQLKEDREFLQNTFMYMSNRLSRSV